MALWISAGIGTDGGLGISALLVFQGQGVVVEGFASVGCAVRTTVRGTHHMSIPRPTVGFRLNAGLRDAVPGAFRVR